MNGYNRSISRHGIIRHITHQAKDEIIASVHIVRIRTISKSNIVIRYFARCSCWAGSNSIEIIGMVSCIQILCVIFNNQTYNAPKWAIQDAYGEQGYSVKTGQFIGVDLTPSPDYALVARACGGYGQVVEEPEDVKQAIINALEQVRLGKPAVLDVRIKQRPFI